VIAQERADSALVEVLRLIQTVEKIALSVDSHKIVGHEPAFNRQHASNCYAFGPVVMGSMQQICRSDTEPKPQSGGHRFTGDASGNQWTHYRVSLFEAVCQAALGGDSVGGNLSREDGEINLIFCVPEFLRGWSLRYGANRYEALLCLSCTNEDKKD
jgi:hypothetical protein